MGKLAEAYVEVGSKTQGFDDGLSRAEKSLQSFVGRGQSLLAGLGAGAVVGSAIGFLTKAVTAASDLAETVNKVTEAFGSASTGVIRFADEMADKFGLVKKVTLDAAANIGLILQGSGVSSGPAADLSAKLVKLAADASSFYNVELDVALEKIRAGLVGEAEPLRTFGVLLSEDAVKAEAYRSGLAGVGRELTDQEKVTARAAIIMRDLGVVSGDLERTQDGLANQLRKVKGDLENFAAKIGESLVPAVSDLIAIGYDIRDAFDDAFGTGPLDAFKSGVEELRDELLGLRVIIKGLMSGDFTAASENLLFEKLGKAITGFAGDVASGGVKDRPKKNLAAIDKTKKFLFGGEGGHPDPTGLLGLLSPFGALSPLGMAALRTEPRRYDANSQRMDAASFGADAIMRSLEGSQSPMAKQLEEQRRGNEHLKDILDELKRPKERPGQRAGVFPRRGR